MRVAQPEFSHGIARHNQLLNSMTSPGADQYAHLAQELDIIAKDFPNYPPLKERRQVITNQIRNCLLYAYNDAVSQKHLKKALRLNKDWEKYLQRSDMDQFVAQSFDSERSIAKIIDKLDIASENASIAEKLWIRKDISATRHYLQKSLEICADLPDALSLQNQLSHWDIGVSEFKRIDQCIKAYDHSKHTDLRDAQKSLNKIIG